MLSATFVLCSCGSGAVKSGENLGTETTEQSYQTACDDFDEIPEGKLLRVSVTATFDVPKSDWTITHYDVNASFDVSPDGTISNQTGTETTRAVSLVTNTTTTYLFETAMKYYANYISNPSIGYYTEEDGGVGMSYYGTGSATSSGVTTEYNINCEYKWNAYGYLTYAYEYNTTKASASGQSVSVTAKTNARITYELVDAAE